MDDLESKEIKVVIDNVLNSNMRYFNIFLTPHHGTHWNKILLNLNCNHAVSSCGARHYRNLRFEYDRISFKHYTTWRCGDVVC